MKRKSLLVAMAAMSLAAIGAGSVSTLAWYQAVQGATVKEDNAVDVSLSTGDPSYNVGSSALPLNVTITRVTDGSNDAVAGALELTKYYETAPSLTNPIVEINGKKTPSEVEALSLSAGLYSGSLDAGSKLHLQSTPMDDSHKFVAVYKAHIVAGDTGEYDGIYWDATAMKTQLAKRYATITLKSAVFAPVTSGTYSNANDYYQLNNGTATKANPQPTGSYAEGHHYHVITEDTSDGKIRFLDSTDEGAVTKNGGTTTYSLGASVTPVGGSGTIKAISLENIASGVDVLFGVRVEAEATAEADQYVYAPFTVAIADGGARVAN